MFKKHILSFWHPISWQINRVKHCLPVTAEVYFLTKKLLIFSPIQWCTTNKHLDCPWIFVIISADCICTYSKANVRVSVLPDRTVPAVRILSCYSAHLCATWWILIYIHDIGIHRKDRRFIHIPNCNFKGGSVFERTKIGKTWIHMCIHPLNVESVGLFSLIVQRLSEKGTAGTYD